MGQVLETVVVQSKDELKNAVKSGYSEIIVVGDLAKKVRSAYKIKNKIPFLGEKFKGEEPTVAALASALSGVEIAIILAVVFVGLSLLILLTKGYDLDVELSENAVKLKKTKSAE